MPSWDDLRKPVRVEPRADEFADLCFITLSSGPGERLLKMFRQMTIEKALPPGSDVSALPALEAQRQFVRVIEAAVVRGRAMADAKTKAKSA